MKRGDLYVATPPGDHSKPRPVVIVQSDLFIAARDSITVCLLSSETIDASLFRVRVKRAPHNRLKRNCDVMADKIMTVRKERLGEPLGALTTDEIVAVDQALRR